MYVKEILQFIHCTSGNGLFVTRKTGNFVDLVYDNLTYIHVIEKVRKLKHVMRPQSPRLDPPLASCYVIKQGKLQKAVRLTHGSSWMMTLIYLFACIIIIIIMTIHKFVQTQQVCVAAKYTLSTWSGKHFDNKKSFSLHANLCFMKL